MDLGNHVLGVQIPPRVGAILRKGAPIVKYRDTAVTYAKTAELIVMPFGLVPRSHELDGGPDTHDKGQFWKKGSPIPKYKDFLP